MHFPPIRFQFPPASIHLLYNIIMIWSSVFFNSERKCFSDDDDEDGDNDDLKLFNGF